MNETSDKRRQELLTEYYKLADYLQEYDAHFLKIKAWSVTVSGVVAGIGATQLSAAAFAVASVLGLSFWLTEVRFKLFQLAHMWRVSELEAALAEEDPKARTPLIFESFSQGSQIERQRRRWKSIVFWPQVMFPHVFFVVLGMLGTLAASFRSLF